MSENSQAHLDFAAPPPAKRAREAGRTPDFNAANAIVESQNQLPFVGRASVNPSENRRSTLDFNPKNKCGWQMANTHPGNCCEDIAWLERDIRQIQQAVCHYFMWVSGVPEPQPAGLARHWYALGRYIWDGHGDRQPSQPNPHSCNASDKLQAILFPYQPEKPILDPEYTSRREGFQPNVEEMVEAVRGIFAYRPAPVSREVKLLALESWRALRSHPFLVDWRNCSDEEAAQVAQETRELVVQLEQIERDSGRGELFPTGAVCLGSGSRKRSFDAAGLGVELPKRVRSSMEIVDDILDFVTNNWSWELMGEVFASGLQEGGTMLGAGTKSVSTENHTDRGLAVPGTSSVANFNTNDPVGEKFLGKAGSTKAVVANTSAAPLPTNSSTSQLSTTTHPHTKRHHHPRIMAISHKSDSSAGSPGHPSASTAASSVSVGSSASVGSSLPDLVADIPPQVNNNAHQHLPAAPTYANNQQLPVLVRAFMSNYIESVLRVDMPQGAAEREILFANTINTRSIRLTPESLQMFRGEAGNFITDEMRNTLQKTRAHGEENARIAARNPAPRAVLRSSRAHADAEEELRLSQAPAQEPSLQQILARQRRDSGPTGEQMLGRASMVRYTTKPDSRCSVMELQQQAGQQTVTNTSVTPVQHRLPESDAQIFKYYSNPGMQGGHLRPYQQAPAASAPTPMTNPPAMSPGHPTNAPNNVGVRFGIAARAPTRDVVRARVGSEFTTCSAGTIPAGRPMSAPQNTDFRTSGPHVGSVPTASSGYAVPSATAPSMSAAPHAAFPHPIAAPHPMVAPELMAMPHPIAAHRPTSTPQMPAMFASASVTLGTPHVHPNAMPSSARRPTSHSNIPAGNAFAGESHMGGYMGMRNGQLNSNSMNSNAGMSTMDNHGNNPQGNPSPCRPFAANTNTSGFVDGTSGTSAPYSPCSVQHQQYGGPHQRCQGQRFGGPQHHVQGQPFGGPQHHGHGQVHGHGHGQGHLVGMAPPQLQPPTAPTAPATQGNGAIVGHSAARGGWRGRCGNLRQRGSRIRGQGGQGQGPQ